MSQKSAAPFTRLIIFAQVSKAQEPRAILYSRTITRIHARCEGRGQVSHQLTVFNQHSHERKKHTPPNIGKRCRSAHTTRPHPFPLNSGKEKSKAHAARLIKPFLPALTRFHRAHRAEFANLQKLKSTLLSLFASLIPNTITISEHNTFISVCMCCCWWRSQK